MRLAIGGTTIAAATTWVAMRTSLVAVEALTSRSGTSDSAVSTTVVTTNVRRGRDAHFEEVARCSADLHELLLGGDAPAAAGERGMVREAGQ